MRFTIKSKDKGPMRNRGSMYLDKSSSTIKIVIFETGFIKKKSVLELYHKFKNIIEDYYEVKEQTR
jgi:hypothetical protein